MTSSLSHAHSHKGAADAPVVVVVVSVYMTVVLAFITHSFVNAALLSGWNNGIRCYYWNRSSCSSDHAWMLNWFSYGQMHVAVLLSALAKTALGNSLLEQRLAHLVCAIMVSYLSNGIFMMDYLNKPMALLQGLVYLGLLGTAVVGTSLASSSSSSTAAATMEQERRLLFWNRRQLKKGNGSIVPMAVVGLLTIPASFQVMDMVFLYGRDGYVGIENTRGDALFQNMSNASVTQWLWTTFILAWSTAMASIPQLKSLLFCHALVLFVAQIMLTGYQGQQLHADQAQAACIGNFCSLILSLFGAFY